MRTTLLTVMVIVIVTVTVTVVLIVIVAVTVTVSMVFVLRILFWKAIPSEFFQHMQLSQPCQWLHCPMPAHVPPNELVAAGHNQPGTRTTAMAPHIEYGPNPIGSVFLPPTDLGHGHAHRLVKKNSRDNKARILPIRGIAHERSVSCNSVKKGV